MKNDINKIYMSIMFIVIAISQTGIANALYEFNFTTPATRGLTVQPNFQVMVLKYDPYPVNPGDWFNVWIKVENLGQDDAKNVKFELVPTYPFSATDGLVSTHNTFFGIDSAYKSGEQKDANVAILKYRVKMADNAPAGDSNLKLMITTDYLYADMETNMSYYLGISAAKTKTDFDVVLQDATTQGMSFSIANIGANPANAITVTLDRAGMMNTTGPSSTILGNLASGDFTTMTFAGFTGRNAKEIKMNISYTDIVGIRNTITKTIPTINNANGNFSGFGGANTGARRTGVAGVGSNSAAYTPYLYFTGGFFAGILAMMFFKRKKKTASN